MSAGLDIGRRLPIADEQLEPGARPTGDGFTLLQAGDTVGGLLGSARAQLAAAGADSPGLTALVLLEHATGLPRTTLLAYPEMVPAEEAATQFARHLERRCRREPLAYILGHRDFCGRRFAVSPATLIPRPETERLVEIAVERLDRESSSDRLALLDVGTGSGAIAISVLAERADIAAVGTDSSPAALAVAAENARTHGVADRLRLIACDLAHGVRPQFPLVLANLPYVPSRELLTLEPEVAEYEPRPALDGGADGMRITRRFLAGLDQILAPGGLACLEVAELQAAPLSAAARGLLPDYDIEVQRDYAGAERFLLVERPER